VVLKAEVDQAETVRGRSFYEVATALSFAGDVLLEDMEEMIV
jgi:hypothetical protein